MRQPSARLAFRQKLDKVRDTVMKNLDYAGQLEDQLRPYIDLSGRIDQLQQLITNLQRNRFELVVVGEFSTGKSTFINALMGKKILPDMARPTTATVNFIRHVEQHPARREEAVVYFENGETKAIAFDDLQEYVTEMSQNISVVEDIHHVDIFVDSRYLEDGVVIVDTPGLKSLHKKHDAITHEQIRRSNASILLFSANQPGRDTEFQFLSQISQSIERIFFVANMCDLVKPEELPEVVSDLESKLRDNPYHKVPAGQARMFPTSALMALAARDPRASYLRPMDPVDLLEGSRFAPFEERLWTYLAHGEKAQEALRQPLVRVQQFYDEVLLELGEYLATLQNQVDEAQLEDDVAQIKEAIESRRLALRDQREGIMVEIRDLKDDFRETFERDLKNVATQLHSQCQGYASVEEFNDDLGRLQGHIGVRLAETSQTSLGKLKGSIADLVLRHADAQREQLEALIASKGATFDVAIGLREIKRRTNLEVEQLKAEQQRLASKKSSHLEQRQQLEQAWEAADHNRRLDAKIEGVRDRFEDQRNVVLGQLRVEPDSHLRYHKVDREGLFGYVQQKCVGKKVEQYHEVNPRVKELRSKLEGLEGAYNQKLQQLEVAKREIKMSDTRAQSQLDRVDRLLQELDRNYQSVNGQLMQRLLRANEEELERLAAQIRGAIDGGVAQILLSYETIVAKLDAEGLVKQFMEEHQQQHDGVIVEMDKRLRVKQELLQKNQDERAEIEQLLGEVSRATEGKRRELSLIQDSLAVPDTQPMAR